MKIFYAFLVVLLTAILFLLPVPDGFRDFVSDLSTDTFTAATAGGVTSATVTLPEPIYNDNRNFASVLSSNGTDVPVISAYNATSQNVTVTGLIESASRTLTVEYSVYTLPGGASIEKFTGYLPVFWILICFAFPIVALICIFLL